MKKKNNDWLDTLTQAGELYFQKELEKALAQILDSVFAGFDAEQLAEIAYTNDVDAAEVVAIARDVEQIKRDVIEASKLDIDALLQRLADAQKEEAYARLSLDTLNIYDVILARVRAENAVTDARRLLFSVAHYFVKGMLPKSFMVPSAAFVKAMKENALAIANEAAEKVNKAAPAVDPKPSNVEPT
jgi:ATP-dependent exoDNAse (exonuclease V) beta subunit